MTTGLARYAIAVIGLILGAGALLGALFHAPGELAAIAVSGGVALVVQLGVVAIGRALGDNLQARMGSGALLRLFALVAYAFAAIKVGGVPLAAALISLAVFFFLSTLVEPLLIKS